MKVELTRDELTAACWSLGHFVLAETDEGIAEFFGSAHMGKVAKRLYERLRDAQMGNGKKGGRCGQVETIQHNG